MSEMTDNLEDENVDEGILRTATTVAKRKLGPAGRKAVKQVASDATKAAATAAGDKIVQRAGELGSTVVDKLTTRRKPVMSAYEYDDQVEVLEGEETKTLDTKSEEDPNLYQDAGGGHAKIDTDKGTEGKDKKNKGTISSKASAASAKIDKPSASGSSQERLEQHLGSLFDGEDLTEDFKAKASTIFEAVISERVNEIEENILEQYQNILTEHIEETTNELTEKLDDYLNYVVEQWVSDNQLAIEKGIRTDVAENFIGGLKTLFENCYIDMPDEKYDMVDDVIESNNQLEGKLNSIFEENVALRKEIIAHRCGEIFAEEASGLVDTEVEKLASLSEGLEFENEGQYREKVKILRENYFNDNVEVSEEAETTNKQIITEGNTNPVMDRYLSTISRHSTANKVS